MDDQALAHRLAAARRAGGLVDDAPVLDLAAGYAVAGLLAPLLGDVIGWKIGATSAGAQAFLQVDAPIFGRLFARWADGSTVRLAGDRAVEAEPEIIVRLGADLTPDAAWFGVEFNRSSFADPFGLGAGAIIADNAASLGVLVGPPLPLAALADPAELVARLLVDQRQAGIGSAADVLGNPLVALDWLRGALVGDARGLQPGDLVATGGMCRSALAAKGATVTVDAAGFGRASVELA